jgi:hypothetical protein
MPKKIWNKFNNKNSSQQSWILAMPEEVNLLNTLKDLHRLNNNIGKENESYINFIYTMNNFYTNILSENKNK